MALGGLVARLISPTRVDLKADSLCADSIGNSGNRRNSFPPLASSHQQGPPCVRASDFPSETITHSAARFARIVLCSVREAGHGVGEVNPDFAKGPERKCPELAPRDASKSVSGVPRRARRAPTVGHYAKIFATLRSDPEVPVIPETCWRTDMDSNPRSGLCATCPGKRASICL